MDFYDYRVQSYVRHYQCLNMPLHVDVTIYVNASQFCSGKAKGSPHLKIGCALPMQYNNIATLIEQLNGPCISL